MIFCDNPSITANSQNIITSNDKKQTGLTLIAITILDWKWRIITAGMLHLQVEWDQAYIEKLIQRRWHNEKRAKIHRNGEAVSSASNMATFKHKCERNNLMPKSFVFTSKVFQIMNTLHESIWPSKSIPFCSLWFHGTPPCQLVPSWIPVYHQQRWFAAGF